MNNEKDAFLLENNLIKKFKPPFNINLKDDKSYPYIVIKNEAFPRVFFTRNKSNDGSQYLGPYTSVARVKELLEFIKKNILLRTCTLNLTSNNIDKKKFKVCLEYHLGNCKGPCEGLQSKEDYDNDINQLKNILNGNLSQVIKHFKLLLKEYIKQLEFEKAAAVKIKIDYLLDYKLKSIVINERLGTLDVFSILQEGNTAYVNFLSIHNGYIVQTKTITLNKKLEETEEEILVFAIAQIRDTFQSEAKEIIVPFQIDYPEKEIRITVPKTGAKKNLLDLSEKNVNHFKAELKKKKLLLLENSSQKDIRDILKQIQKDLHLIDLPSHIECFDNSNFQGSFPVSAMVCFKNGLPAKNDYRKFNVKTVVGIDDFGTMKEAVYRRYKRVIEEGTAIPQLIIIDGGKGQLSAAMESIRALNLQTKTTVIGLAKNEEEIFFHTDKESIKLPWDNEGLKLIRRIRDEVHRFGITFHRNQRSKNSLLTELDNIKGIGKSTVELLLQTFKSFKNIQGKTESELADVVGNKRASLLIKYFENKKASQ